MTFGCDFGMFWGAAKAVQVGANPFIPSHLHLLEHRALILQGIHSIAPAAVVRVGNPSLFFWLIGPLARVPFRQAAVVWSACAYLSCGLGMWLGVRSLGWRTWAAPVALFLISPQVVLAVIYGNVVHIIFLALAGCLAFSGRAPIAAGALGSVAWLKPSLAIPFVALILLFSCANRRRAIAGFCVATVLWLLLWIRVMGVHAIPQWLAGMRGYTVDMASQPGMASLSGLYVRWAPLQVQSALEMISIGIAATLTIWFWMSHGRATLPFQNVAWLWFLWFLAGPYAHFTDEILLAFPVAALLGRHGDYLDTGSVRAALYGLYGSLFLLPEVPFDVQLIPIPLVVTLVLIAPVSSRMERVFSTFTRPGSNRRTIGPVGEAP